MKKPSKVNVPNANARAKWRVHGEPSTNISVETAATREAGDSPHSATSHFARVLEKARPEWRVQLGESSTKPARKQHVGGANDPVTRKGADDPRSIQDELMQRGTPVTLIECISGDGKVITLFTPANMTSSISGHIDQWRHQIRLDGRRKLIRLINLLDRPAHRRSPENEDHERVRAFIIPKLKRLAASLKGEAGKATDLWDDKRRAASLAAFSELKLPGDGEGPLKMKRNVP